MGAWYVPEIFVPSEKRILSPSFNGSYFVPPSGFLPAADPTRKTPPVRNLCHIPVWRRIRFIRFFAMCRLLFGVFYRIEKQPAYYGFVEFAFQMAFGGKFGFGHSACS